MDGAFNSVVASLQSGASEAEVIDALEFVLRPYGLVIAHGGEGQYSHRFLSEELHQLRAQAAILPTIFLLVSTFLLNVVMSRIIRTQREQVAVLKAFGYANRDIAMHYRMLTGFIVLRGLGGRGGARCVGGERARGYLHEVISFSRNALPASGVGNAAGVSGGRRGWLEHFVLGTLLSPSTRIIFRNLVRHPVKAALSVAGIGMSASLLMMGAYQLDAVDHMIDTQYRLVQRMDVQLTFGNPTPVRVSTELRHQPGVMAVETYRSVPVRLISGHRRYSTAILGLEAEPQLRQLLDGDQRPQRLPPQGLLLTDLQAAADVLGVGFRVEAEVILWEGDDIVQIPPSALFREAGRWSVFVIDDARARLRHVDLGRRAGLVTQVAEGLSPGDSVITHPGDRVRDGVRVAADVR